MMVSQIAAGCLSVIWMRQQIAAKAESITRLECELHTLERQCNSLRGKIAKLHNPQHLMVCLEARGCTQPDDLRHVVWMDADIPAATAVAMSSTPLDKRLAQCLN